LASSIYSSSAGGKVPSSDTQIRLISPMEPEICWKMLKNLSEKLAAKFPATALRYSMVKIARLNDAFSESFELEKAQQKVNHCAERQRKGEKKKLKN